MTAFTYIGSELELFARATRWKAYFGRRLRPYLGKAVLEVGAGLGGTTQLLCGQAPQRWVCLEPDAQLASRLSQRVHEGALPASCEVVVGTLGQMTRPGAFDTLLYIDVLEHIEDDRAELTRAAEQLSPGGHVLVLAPAHQWLTTPFDQAIGHFRRYNKRMLRAITPASLELRRLQYLDSVGLLASLGNRLVLKSAMPNPGQIAFWDHVLVPLSRVLDPLLVYSIGKSILAVYRKKAVPE